MQEAENGRPCRVRVAVCRRQKTGALVADELALRGTPAYMAVRPVRLSKLQGRAGRVVEDVLTRVKEALFTFHKTAGGGLTSVFCRERR